MKTTTGLLAILLSGCLIFACGGSKDDKKGEDEKADKDKDKDDKKSDDKKSDDKKEGATADKGKQKLPPGNFGALLAGKSKKKVNDTMKGTGLGLGSILGGMGGGSMPGASGGAPARKAPAAEPVASPAADTTTTSPASPPSSPPAAPPAAPVAGASDADCDKVASHLIDMALAQGGAEIPAEYKAQMAAMMEEARAEVAKMCATQFSPEIKQCVLSSKTMDDMNKCEQLFNQMGGGGGGHADHDMHDDHDYYDEPDTKPVGDAPKWDGKDSSCQATGEHMGKLLMWMYSGEDDSTADMSEMLVEMVPQMVELCESGKWPEEARVCILKSQSEDDMDDCAEMLGM
jgi:hypothetical protein